MEAGAVRDPRPGRTGVCREAVRVKQGSEVVGSAAQRTIVAGTAVNMVADNSTADSIAGTRTTRYQRCSVDWAPAEVKIEI